MDLFKTGDSAESVPRVGAKLLIAVALVISFATPALSDEGARDRRIDELERQVRQLVDEVRKLKSEDAADSVDRHLSDLDREILAVQESDALDPHFWANRLTIGGYGELHWNFGEGSSPDQFDIHRFVLFLAYQFGDSLTLFTEIEIEHAFSSSDSGGEVLIEQLHLDHRFGNELNLRFGRFLTPLGIINQRHDPPAFNGVERPLFERVIIPSTWSADGAGIFGAATPWLGYQACVVAGLDGSGFSAVNGIRGGRMKERPGMTDPALTGRLDFFPFVVTPVELGQVLRFGVGTWIGGTDNANKGASNGLEGGKLEIYSADVEYSITRFDLKGQIAWEKINNAEEIGNGTASEILGWYLEAGVHLLPEHFRLGGIGRSDLVAFVRYEDVNTQYRMPDGVEVDPAGDRTLWTFGLTWFIRPNLVLKADYQILDDASDEDQADLFNVGIGWQF